MYIEHKSLCMYNFLDSKSLPLSYLVPQYGVSFERSILVDLLSSIFLKVSIVSRRQLMVNKAHLPIILVKRKGLFS